ncbi:stalk domain-containing protein [Peptoniphilus raoultii]|uniref:stalk domain-containing protein n=1 Tax=Peptoniphilus raoultii TaxID=1776387 RepID=UPI0008DA77B2|nr:stalk domain-containing protein [Peptoniphilus raoultii]
MRKKFFIFFTLITVLLLNIAFAESTKTHEEIIAPGVTRYEYNVDTSKGKAIVNVLKCDLNDPNLKITTVAGGGTYTNKATVSQMGDRTNAVGLVNGDFFTMALQGVPLGGSIIDGDIKSSPAVLTDIYSFGIDDTNTCHILATNFGGSVIAPNGAKYPIDGLNKTFYWYQPSKEYSHAGKIQMYNDFWTSKSRGDKTAGEVLLSSENVVEEIVYDKNLDMAIPKGKKILQISGESANFIKTNVKVGDKLTIDYGIFPQKNWKTLIGGHSLLVDKGKVREYKKDINSIGGTRARTCVGYGNDGKICYIVSAEGRTKRSKGMTLNELSNFMLSLGCQKALNLDGGGSSAMVVRNLGDLKRTRVINPESGKGERKVVNGLGVFNTSVNSGVIKDLKFEGKSDLLIGEATDFSVKSAWDELLNPIDIKDRTFTISENSQGANILNGASFLPLNPGKFQLTFTSNKGESVSKEINVNDASAIESLSIKSEKKKVTDGSNLKFEIFANSNGKKIKLSPRVFSYEIEGFDGEVDIDNSQIKINGLGENPKLIAKIADKSAAFSLYDADSKVIVMTIGKKTYSIDGENKEMDASPFIKNSRTLVPLRFIVEAMGGIVDWNGEEKTASIKLDSVQNVMKVKIGAKEIIVDDDMVLPIDSPAIIKDDRTYVPVRFIAEFFKMEVSYDGANKEITIVDRAAKDRKTANTKNPSVDEEVVTNGQVENNSSQKNNTKGNANHNSNASANSKASDDINYRQMEEESKELENIIRNSKSN